MMYAIEITFHAQLSRYLYETLEDAQKELDTLTPLLGKAAYNAYQKEISDTHIINSPAGPGVLILSKIESARIINLDKHNDLARAYKNRVDDEQIQRALKWKEAGVELKPVIEPQ